MLKSKIESMTSAIDSDWTNSFHQAMTDAEVWMIEQPVDIGKIITLTGKLIDINTIRAVSYQKSGDYYHIMLILKDDTKRPYMGTDTEHHAKIICKYLISEIKRAGPNTILRGDRTCAKLKLSQNHNS